MTLEKLIVIISAETKQLETAIDRVKAQLNSVENTASRMGKSITKNFSKSATGLNKAFRAIGLAGITAGLISFSRSALSAASELQEWQNVVEVAFGDAVDQVNAFSKSAIYQFGLSELAAKKLAGNFMALADGIGISNKAGAKMAIQLSGLAADMASFFNTTTDATQTALQGIFTGQTRALKQYGIVMNETNLEAFRMARGIQTAYSQMSEAQRVALRYNYVLAQTANAQNDYARTAGSWANQMRLLTNNWHQLISSVGNGLIQLLTPILKILNKILAMAVAVVNAIAKIFGGKGVSVSPSGGGGGGSPLGGLADDASDVGNNLDDATDSAKKFKATIAGFDELETLNPQSSGGGGGGGFPGGGDIGDLDDYFDVSEFENPLSWIEDWLKKLKDLMDADDWEGVGAEIAKVLNKWLKTLDDWIVNVFEPWGVKWASRIARVFNGLVEYLDWELLGKTIGDGLNALIHIANTFLETFDALKLGEGIGRAVNSWFNTVDWTGIGHFFANNLNFFIDIAAGFFDEFIKQANSNGKKLGEAFNAFVDWIHWDNLSRAIWEGLNSIAQVILGFVTQVDWETLKAKVNGALQDIFDNLDMNAIKNAVSGVVNNVMDFLKSIDWYQIGHTVGEMLSAVNWLGVFMDVKDKIIWPAVKGFWDGLMSDGKNFLLGSVGKIVSWFKVSFWGPLMAALLKVISIATIGNVILGALRGFFAGDFSTSLVSAFASSMNWVTGNVGGLVPGWGAAFAKAFKPLTAYFNTSAVEMTDSFSGLLSFLKLTLPEAFKAFGSVLGEVAGPIAIAAALVATLTSSYGGLNGVMEKVGSVFNTVKENVKKFAESINFAQKIDNLKKAFGNLGDAIGKIYDALARLKPLWDIFFSALGFIVEGTINIIVGAISGFADVLSGVVNIVAGVVSAIMDLFNGNLAQLPSDVMLIVEGIFTAFGGLMEIVVGPIAGFIQSVIDFFKDLKYQLIGDPIVLDMVNGIIQAFNDFVTSALEVFSGFVEWFVGLFQAIYDNTVIILESMYIWLSEKWTAIKNNVEETWVAIQTFIETTWNAIVFNTQSIWNGIYTWIKTKWEEMLKLLKDTWDEMKKKVEETWNLISGSTNTWWEGIKTFMKDTWDSIFSKTKETTEKIKGKVEEHWGNVKTETIDRWNDVASHIKTKWGDIVKDTEDNAKSVYTTVLDKWKSIKEDGVKKWEDIQTDLKTAWEGIVTEAESNAGAVSTWWNWAYSAIAYTWSAFPTFWNDIWSGLADVVKSALNAVISKLNSFHVDIPDWVPGFGGESFGFDIPYLANGGIIDSPTVAMLGEYSGARTNPEIATPQKLLEQIMTNKNDELIDVWVQTTRQIIAAIEDVDLNVSIGDDQIADSVSRINDNYIRRTGKPLFSM